MARSHLALISALAQNLGLIERSKEAREALAREAERAIADDPGSSEVLGNAGCALADLDQPERGAEILRQACEIDPSNAQAKVALGAALAMLGDLTTAIDLMRLGIKISPRDRRLGFWGSSLAHSLMQASRENEAVEEARIAARRDPQLHLPLLVEAVAQVRLGRTELARAALASARRVRPQLSLREIEISYGRAAGRIVAGLWDGAEATPADGG